MTITIRIETTSQVTEVEIQTVGAIEFFNGRAVFFSVTGSKYEIPAEGIVRIRPL